MRASITELRKLVASPKTEMAAPAGTRLALWQEKTEAAREVATFLRDDFRILRRSGHEEFGEALWKKAEIQAKAAVEALGELRVLLTKMETPPQEVA